MVAGAVLLTLFGATFVLCLARSARRHYWRPVILTGVVAVAVGVLLIMQWRGVRA